MENQEYDLFNKAMKEYNQTKPNQTRARAKRRFVIMSVLLDHQDGKYVSLADHA